MKTIRATFLLPLFAALFAGLAASTVFAADPAPAADWQARLDRADALIAEARAKQAAANAELTEADRACYGKFLVNRCRDEAHKAHVVATREARRLENEGRAIEREVKREQLAEKDRERAASEPQRDQEHADKARQVAAEREQAAAERAAKLADKERKAEEGVRRRAAEAERLAKKQADHAARVAAKIEASERKAAEKAAAGE